MTTLVPEPKTTHPTSSPLPAVNADTEPAARIPAGPPRPDLLHRTQTEPVAPVGPLPLKGRPTDRKTVLLSTAGSLAAE